MRKLIAFGIAVFVLLPGCGGGPNMVYVGNVKAKSKGSGCAMPIYEKEADVEKPFEKLCIVTPAPAKTVADVRPDLQKAGCTCGADAVVITNIVVQEKKAVVTAAGIRFLNVAAPATPAPK